MKLTMREIAKMAGVSITTVSLVLNDKEARISQKQRTKIKNIARENNYVPNSSAVSLAKNESKTIGVIVPNINNPFYSSLIKAISDDLANHGYYALIINSNDNHENESRQVDQLVNRGVDGILLVPSNDLYAQGTDVVTAFLNNIKIPFVLVNANSALPINQVNLDNVKGGYLATESLIENGHTKIAIVTGKKGFVNAEERLLGYKKALEAYNLPFNPKLVFRASYDLDGGFYIIPKIQATEVSAIFFCSDLMLYGAVKQFNENHKNLFEQYSVIGYDDTFFNDVFNPTITSVKQDVFDLGRKAVKVLYDTLTKQTVTKEKLTVDLKIRQSVKKIN